MSRRLELPTPEALRLRVDELRRTTSTRLTVVAVARDLGISNASLWRHFPDIADEIVVRNRAARLVKATPADMPPDAPRDEISSAPGTSGDKKRETVASLKAQLQVAAESVQRLTLENQRLRTHLEQLGSIASIPKRSAVAPSTDR